MTVRTTCVRAPGVSAVRLALLVLVFSAMAGCGSQEKPPAPPKKIDTSTLAPAYADISPKRSKVLDHPYTSGKVVIVDKGRDDENFDVGDGRFNASVAWDLQQNGDGGLLADTTGFGIRAHVTEPDEVGTIVWISCKQRFVAYYAGSGGKAYRTECTATIIDATRNLVVGETTSSLDPPERVTCVAGKECPPHYGGFDDEGFARYLAAQPRKDFTEPVVPR